MNSRNGVRKAGSPTSSDELTLSAKVKLLPKRFLGVVPILALILLSLVPSPASAEQSFREYRGELFKESARVIGAASRQLDSILDVYIGHPTGDITWSDPAIAGHFKRFTEEMAEFHPLPERVLVASSRQYGRLIQRIDRAGRPIRTADCRAWQRSRSKLRLGRTTFARLDKSMERVRRDRRVLETAMMRIEGMIGARPPVTDGYLDDVVYDFGSDKILYMPDGRPAFPFDPVVIVQLAERLFEYGAATDPVFMNGFNDRLANALKSADKASRVCGVRLGDGMSKVSTRRSSLAVRTA